MSNHSRSNLAKIKAEYELQKKNPPFRLGGSPRYVCWIGGMPAPEPRYLSDRDEQVPTDDTIFNFMRGLAKQSFLGDPLPEEELGACLLGTSLRSEDQIDVWNSGYDEFSVLQGDHRDVNGCNIAVR